MGGTITVARTIGTALTSTSSAPAFTFPSTRTSLTRAEVAGRAQRCSAALSARGVARGERILLVCSDPADFVQCFLGALAAGVVPVAVAPAPVLNGGEQWLAHVRAAVTTTTPVLAVVDETAAALLSDVAVPVLTPGQLLAEAARADPVEPVAAEPDEVAYLQLTSGSTGAPRAVMVSHRALLANARAIMVDGLRTDPTRDVGVSWLPLHHDMGLVGFVLAPLLHDIPVVLLPVRDFVRDPSCWMRAMSEHRGTITFAPTFAFALAARRAPADPNALELGRVRVVGCGAEPVRADTLREFAEAFAPSGLRPGALLPCYGLAEATLAVAFSPVGRGVVELDGVTSCGPPLMGVEVRVVGRAGESLPDGSVGEIHVRGRSTASGYLADPEATAGTFGADGWLRTGDLGRLVDGELHVTGRRKDVVIVRGRNLPAQQVEWVVERVPGVRTGGVAAFGVAGAAGEELVVAVEVSGSADRTVVAEAVRAVLAAELQVVPSHVVCVAPRRLPRTTSGKLRRFAIRESWADGTLAAGGR